MTRPRYDDQLEHEVVGTYPIPKALVAKHRMSTEQPKLWRPISPLENYKLLFSGKTPYWMPEAGWTNCDIHEFRPRQHPDNLANHQTFDGGDALDFDALGNVVRGWFNLDYVWEPLSQGCMTKPGNPLLTDMSEWEEIIEFPDLDAMDWQEMHDMNVEYLGTDKVNQLGIQFGMWERLMNLMDVEYAAIALVDDEQYDGIMSFLDRLVDLYIDYIDRVCAIGRIDSIMMHDDWGTNNGPFFSVETCREIFVPHFKRLLAHIHSKGIVFERHCCGKAQNLIDCMLEEGDDYWACQQPLNDVDKLIEHCADYPMTFVVAAPELPRGSTETEVRQIAYGFVEKYASKKVLYKVNPAAGPNHDQGLYPIFKDAVYRFSREAYQDAQD